MGFHPCNLEEYLEAVVPHPDVHSVYGKYVQSEHAPFACMQVTSQFSLSLQFAVRIKYY